MTKASLSRLVLQGALAAVAAVPPVSELAQPVSEAQLVQPAAMPVVRVPGGAKPAVMPVVKIPGRVRPVEMPTLGASEPGGAPAAPMPEVSERRWRQIFDGTRSAK